jgi:hypothetical protein
LALQVAEIEIAVEDLLNTSSHKCEVYGAPLQFYFIRKQGYITWKIIRVS